MWTTSGQAVTRVGIVLRVLPALGNRACPGGENGENRRRLFRREKDNAGLLAVWAGRVFRRFIHRGLLAVFMARY